jgi:long-chain acyl-CoA synthetase
MSDGKVTEQSHHSQTARQAPFWVKNYPKGIPAFIEDTINQYSNILDIFDEACGKFPNHIAFSNMDCTMTFSELNRKSDSLAAFFQNEFKLQKGDRIAIQMPNLLQYPIVMFAALKAGLIIVNTNPLYTEREMKHQFKDSGAKAIVILANFASHLEKILAETDIQHVIVTEIGDMLPFPKRQLVNTVVKYVKKMVPAYQLPKAVNFRDALAKGAAMTLHPVKSTLDEIAFLQYTGGTTGVSKGAMLTHRNIVANSVQVNEWICVRLESGKEIAVCALPLYHIFAMTVHCFAILKLGGHSVLITNPRDLPGFIKTLKKNKITVMSGVNTLFNALMNHKDFASVDLSHFKMSVAGGMALQTAVAKRWVETTKTPVLEGYGLTETSPVVTVNPVDGSDRVGTIGLPVPSTLVKMVDDEGREVKTGEPGEICVKGPQVMKGYWQRPDETTKVLSSDGWLRTGDVALQEPDGFCRIVDRKKDMILVSGFNVYPNEVEDVLATHPGILEVAAVGLPDEHSGEVVKVFIVKRDANLTEKEVIDFARKNLTNYKIPRAVEFRTELPKTNVGKILRRSLRDEGIKK